MRLRFLTLVLFLASSSSPFARIISTVAGGGPDNVSGDSANLAGARSVTAASARKALAPVAEMTWWRRWKSAA